MKLIIAALSCALSISAFAQLPSPARQQCNLIAGMVSNAAGARDNGIPLSKYQRTVDLAIVLTPEDVIMTLKELQQWRNVVASIYASKATSNQIWTTMIRDCKDL